MTDRPHHDCIRLAHIVRGIFPAGKELGILKLIGALDPNCFDSHLVATTLVDGALPVGIPPERLHVLNSHRHGSTYLPRRLYRLFKETSIDIVHTHSWNTLLEGVSAARLARVPAVIHQEHGEFPQQWRHRFLQRLFWNRCDIVLTVSENLSKSITHSTGFPEDRLQAVLNGVDESRFFPSPQQREATRNEFGFGQDDVVVGTVGRVAPVKNQALLLRAAALLRDTGNPVEVVIVGYEHPQYSIRPLVAELNLEERVHFAGHREDINRLLNGFDVFAMTSTREGCSNVVQEALFAGLPVIATQVGGNPELVSHERTGLLVENDDAEGLAAAIRRLIEDPTRREFLAIKGRQNALQQFSLSGMVKQYEAIYRRVLGQRKERINTKHL